MFSDQIREALVLTVGGMGTALAVLVILVGQILVVSWALRTRLIQSVVYTPDTRKTSGIKQQKALVASIAVSVAMANRPDSQDGPGITTI